MTTLDEAPATTGAGPRGARPRLVCSSTPVAFSTGRSVVAAGGSAASAASVTASGGRAPSRTDAVRRAPRGADQLQDR